MRLPHLSLPLLLSLLAGPAPAQDLPYESLAYRFLQSNGRPDATPDGFDLLAFLQDEFLHTQAGLFDLYLPLSAADHPQDLEDYQRLVLGILKAQDRWLDWLEPSAGDLRALRADLATLTRWVGGWKPSAVPGGLGDGARDLLQVLGAKAAVVEASGRCAQALTAGAALGLTREDGRREPLVLVPDRLQFTGFVCLGGWLYPDQQAAFWQPSIATWTNFYIDDVKVLAMRFASPHRQPGDYTSGMRMDTRTPTGLEQQIVQLATNSMLANYYGDRVPPSLAGALAVNLVIDLYGECNTRVDGDLRARRTAAREMFVPGGNPDGGILPPNLADSRWRADMGKDHFTGVLRSAMSKSRKRSASPGFELIDDNERSRREVAGPFLGMAAAESQPLPPRYLGDQLEFLRAYRSCFMHWLREKGAGSSKKKCARAFATLLQELARNPQPERLEEVFTEVYGGKLSSPGLGKQDLETRFLRWLAKGR